MPELPEVETVRRSLLPHLLHKRLERLELVWRRAGEHLPRNAAARIRGARVESLDRRGKYLSISLTEGHLVIHLRMTGKL